MSSSGHVGTSSTYEAGDQRNYSKDEMNEADRFNEGKANSHVPNDSKDERSIANRLAREEKRGKEDESESRETELLKEDATLPAKSHGNKPSRGAEIDQELREEEEAILKKKGAWGPQK